MGIARSREPQGAPMVNVDRLYTSTGALIPNRVVRLAATGNIKHTTGSSGRATLGVTLAGCTGAGKKVPVRMLGIADCEASSRAVAIGDWLRATSGAASTGSRLGGTLRKSTSAVPNIAGLALTSAAAGTGKRLVSVFVFPCVNNGLNLS
jgi:hypothetical protein